MVSSNNWTVLVYQGAANNLEPHLLKNLAELAKATQPENVDVFVRQIDRAGIQRDFVVESDHAQLLGEPVKGVDSASPASLAEFLQLGMRKFPAQHYVVVLSSHGRGADGVIEDERSGKMMSLPELRGALQVAKETNGGLPVDAVVFDACRMMAVETACELQGVAQVVVGSIDRVGSLGLDPAVLLRATSGSSDGYMLARELVGNVEDRQLETFGAISAVALDRAPALQDAMSKLSVALQALPAEASERVRKVVSDCRRSRPSPSYLEGLDNMADSILNQPSAESLKDWLEDMAPADPVAVLEMAQRLAVEPYPELAEAARTVIAAHDAAVLVGRDEPAGGLTVVLPVKTGEAPKPPAHLFEAMTGWSKAVNHIVPAGTPSVASPTWLEARLQENADSEQWAK